MDRCTCLQALGPCTALPQLPDDPMAAYPLMFEQPSVQVSPCAHKISQGSVPHPAGTEAERQLLHAGGQHLQKLGLLKLDGVIITAADRPRQPEDTLLAQALQLTHTGPPLQPSWLA